ncbi:probable serine/threonine-protein kinase samkC [Ipomoea triloba]|uniref:probable serine/threonine-protein kinase samkC n=1 Tax=Ipomoea triloba TaxID=35885 RepID=UPI00125D425B|nr:probable serine/threonine-protein kinase samkC [Ipomoea triloba]
MICSRENEESNSELFQVNNVQQEEEEDERLDSGGAIQQLSMLHLISAAKHHRPTTKTPEKCTSCGGSMKRPSPSFPSSLQEPSPKRLSLLPPSPSPLYRSLSEPIDSLSILNPQTADNSKISPPPPILSDPSPVKNSESRNRPPIPPLHRSLSDPTAAALEFRPSPPQTIKSPAQESPNTKRVKRMKDRLRQMREWWDQVLQEEDEEEEEEEEDNNNSKEEDKGEEAKTSEESVWVEEKGGEGLVIHFKCPCNKGYEILLSGNNCYYKLM